MQKKVKFYGFLLLIVCLMIITTACDMDEFDFGDVITQPLEIISIQAIENLTVEFGTEFGDIDLPEEAEVTLSDNSSTTLDINWLEGNYDGETAGTYTIAGELELIDDIRNPDNLYPTVKVIVRGEDITLYNVSVNYNDNKGTIVGDGDYEEGEEVKLTAIPDEGYVFGEWTGYLESSQTQITFDMPAKNVELNALFEEKTSDFAGGSGIEDDPYLISTAEQLNKVREHLNRHFKQINDIDLSNFGEGIGWVPIGDEDNPYTGSFDGDGNKIYNLEINRHNADYIGLFGVIEKASLNNIKLEDVFIDGGKYVGGLAGSNWKGNINNCSVVGRIEGVERVGTLTGENNDGVISGSRAGGQVVANRGAGGLIGYNMGEVYSSSSLTRVVTVSDGTTGGFVGYNRGMIVNSYSTGDVQGAGSLVGGFVGLNTRSGSISKSFAKGEVEGSTDGTDYTGGFAGQITRSASIGESYAVGNVYGGQSNTVGGFAGRIGDYVLFGSNHTGYISESYSVGKVETERSEASGLVGHFIKGAVTNSYYNKEISGVDDYTKKGIPKTTEEMLQQSTFGEWDFSFVWEIDEGNSYPYLQWQEENIPYPPE